MVIKTERMKLTDFERQRTECVETYQCTERQI